MFVVVVPFAQLGVRVGVARKELFHDFHALGREVGFERHTVSARALGRDYRDVLGRTRFVGSQEVWAERVPEESYRQ